MPGVAATFFSVIPSLGSFLAFGAASLIYRITDGGDTRTALSTPEAPDPAFSGLFDEDSGNIFHGRSFYGALGMAGRLTVVGGFGTIITSPDNGDSWSILQQSDGLEGGPEQCYVDPRPSKCLLPADPRLLSVSSIGSRLVMVGNGGTILTSDDEGNSRMARESGTTENIQSVLGLGAGLGCYFIAVGNGGTVLVSTE